jgi:hypothetical protein
VLDAHFVHGQAGFGAPPPASKIISMLLLLVLVLVLVLVLLLLLFLQLRH